MIADSGAGNLSFRKAIIIGANGGIGSSVAIALARQGIESALVGRNEKAINVLAKTCTDAGAKSIPLVCDIAHINTIESTVNTAIDLLGGLNYLINCAGISADEKLHETDLTSSEAILDTNLRAHMYFRSLHTPGNKQAYRWCCNQDWRSQSPLYGSKHLFGREPRWRGACRGDI